MKVPVHRSFLLVLLCVAILFGMYWIPSFRIGELDTRQVDILSDLRFDESELDEELLDTTLIIVPPVVSFVDTCKSGITCIEDFSDSTNRGMEPFYEALCMNDTSPRPVRIAYFGDSFIEGDILTADLRSLLQTRFGGCGVGYVDIASNTNGFRPTVRHHYNGWDFHNITDSVGFDRSLQGIANRYFNPYAGAYVEYRGIKDKYPLLDTCQQATIYLWATDSLNLVATINGHSTVTHNISPVNRLQSFTEKSDIGSIRWTVPQSSSSVFYGVSLDGTTGISLDNFSVRGSSGLSLYGVPTPFLTQFNSLRPYDLIILQYGLNVATERGVNYDNYYNGMCNVISHLKKVFPQSGILVVGVGDRAFKDEDGDLRTMPGVRNLIKYQQKLAVDTGVSFWNLYIAMGGEGSIQDMSVKGMASLDYTHINFKGGAHIAQLLYESIIYGYEQHIKRKLYANQ